MHSRFEDSAGASQDAGLAASEAESGAFLVDPYASACQGQRQAIGYVAHVLLGAGPIQLEQGKLASALAFSPKHAAKLFESNTALAS